ncbi:caspase family protein [Marinovum sp. 2_MG-2023]|uniref:caspase family protein n=1 Tax=unclassified Marinovum TaxID=2647166 RepID=UPI0026E170CC|nr:MULTISPECIES: caspase family protein [unclassified Marinovum]MDO6731332.1 caspase family protein [Marinovum sp. 2_MG-2023]MDO6780769.1 caspase family protein [Marinovum sp. 1_MG-2023]
MKRTASALAILALLTPATALAREAHALLIGASTYPALDKRFWLKGPANDVDLVAQYLASNPALPFDPNNITVLADGRAGAQAPTLAAIRAEFAELTAEVAAGDFVYLHFSGHGSQTPAADPSTELDGLDEIFLPVDVGPWNDTIGQVENALVDDEIGAMIDGLRARGADVWVVFDSCHSGTATRAAPNDEEVYMRQLPAGALHIPADVMAAAEVQSRSLPNQAAPDPRDRDAPPVVSTTPDGDKMGNLVAFFAAQTNETTPEKNMPKGQADRRLQGVFTYTLFETLAERPGITYRQLAQEVLRKYGTQNLARTTPLFEGNLDLPVFGRTMGDRILQWGATRDGDALRLAAGQLHGLHNGTELILLASPADNDDQALARFTVTSSDTFSAKAAGVFDLDALPPGAVLRKVGTVLDLSLNVALPAPGSAPAAALDAALAIIREAGLTGPRIRFVPAGDPQADVRLAVFADSPRPDALWFMTAPGIVDIGELANVPSVSTGDKTAGELADVVATNLLIMSRALNLMKVGAATAGATAVEVEADLVRGRFDTSSESVAPDSRQPLSGAQVPRMVPNDTIGLHISNTTKGPVDFNILYIGSDYSISFMDNGRMQPGDTLDEDYILITDSSFGRERVIVVFSPAEPHSEVEDLSFLEQAAIERTRTAAITHKSGLNSLLDEAGFGDTTRAAISLSRKKKTPDPVPLFLQFELETVRP